MQQHGDLTRLGRGIVVSMTDADNQRSSLPWTQRWHAVKRGGGMPPAVRAVLSVESTNVSDGVVCGSALLRWGACQRARPSRALRVKRFEPQHCTCGGFAQYGDIGEHKTMKRR